MNIERQKSANPVLAKAFKEGKSWVSNTPMSVNGTLQKTAAMLALVACSAYYVWNAFMQGANVMSYAIGGAFAGFIVALIISFKVDTAKYLAPVYALLQGLFLGGISAMIETKYPGIPMRAVGLTFLVAFIMLALYYFRVIRVTERLRTVVVAATLAIATYYFFSWIASLFFHFQPFDMTASLPSIGFSILVVGLAAFNLLLDFDIIERGAQQGAPKQYEWFGAFALTVTLVWLYFEILRLLSKLNSRN